MITARGNGEYWSVEVQCRVRNDCIPFTFSPRKVRNGFQAIDAGARRARERGWAVWKVKGEEYRVWCPAHRHLAPRRAK